MKFKLALLFGVALLTSSIDGNSSCKIDKKAKKCLYREKIEQRNLKLVVNFIQEAFGEHDVTAVDRYISCDYIQHNPQVPDGPQGIRDFLVAFNANRKKEPVDIRHVAVNGDIVWLHVKTTGFKNEPIAIVDIFRVKNDKIVEHWDVIQEIPPIDQSKNSHPMF